MNGEYSPCPAANNPLSRCPYFIFPTGCGGDTSKCYRRRPIPTVDDGAEADLKLLTDGFLAEEIAKESAIINTKKINAARILPSSLQNLLYC